MPGTPIGGGSRRETRKAVRAVVRERVPGSDRCVNRLALSQLRRGSVIVFILFIAALAISAVGFTRYTPSGISAISLAVVCLWMFVARVRAARELQGAIAATIGETEL
jgi:hypothetical protein